MIRTMAAFRAVAWWSAVVVSRATVAAEPVMTPAEAAKAWDAAAADIDLVQKRLQEIGRQFPQAGAARQQALQTEAISLYERSAENLRAIGRAVPLVYKQRAVAGGESGNAADALARSAMWAAYHENRYWDAAPIAEAILEVHPKDPLSLNVAGASEFATHHFEKAVELLDVAAKDKLLVHRVGEDESIAGNDPEEARKYVDYWKKEQEMRAKEDAATGDAQLPRVELETSRGKVLLELFENEAPNTVANFVSLVEKGFYDGSPFHRVIPHFMAQGGMPGKKFGRGDGPGYTIECECYRPDFRRHFAGSLSMAHAGKDTGGSQFFLTHLPTPHLDGSPNPRTHHTVFGRVVEGMPVVAAIQQGDQIVSAKVVRKRNHAYVPVTHPER